MATRRQKEKNARTAVSQYATRSKQCGRTWSPPDTTEETSSSSTGSSGAGIAMLIEAAEMTSTENKSDIPKKLSRRNLASVEVFYLENIQELSYKDLLKFFSVLNSNEMTRVFTSTCYLMPSKCSQSFSSYGNEDQALKQMRKHLLHHIEELIDEAHDPKRTEKFYFKAVPVHVQKESSSGFPMRKFKKADALSDSSKLVKGKQSQCNSNPAKPKNVLPASSDSNKIIAPCVQQPTVEKTSLGTQKECCEGSKENTVLKKSKKCIDQRRNMSRKSALVSQTDVKSSKSASDKSRTSKNSPMKDFNKNSVCKQHVCLKPEEQFGKGQSLQRKEFDENQQLITELLSRQQPHHDHSYTTIFGPRPGFDAMLSSDSSEDEDQAEEQKTFKSTAVPILALHLPVENIQELPMVSSEVIIEQSQNYAEPREQIDTKSQSPVPKPQHNQSEKPTTAVTHPWSTKKRKHSSVKPVVVEAAVSCDDKDEEEINTWEREMAERHIKEMKYRSKNDKIELICQICKDKNVFTAAASLLYHYKSHAVELHCITV